MRGTNEALTVRPSAPGARSLVLGSSALDRRTDRLARSYMCVCAPEKSALLDSSCV